MSFARRIRARQYAVAMATFLLFAVCTDLPTKAQTSCNCVRKKRPTARKHINADLEMAKIYARLKNWSEAEVHFVLAARDPISQKEALAGLEASRMKFNAEKLAGDAAPLEAGKIYQKNDLEAKAEEIYRAAAVSPAVGEITRQTAAGRLIDALEAQKWDRWFSKFKEWMERLKGAVEFLFWALALVLGLIFCVSIIQSIRRRRKMILFHEFKAPNEELSRSLAVTFKHARVRMQNPWLSPAGVMPTVLVRNMPTFDDEFEPIEDLELGGAKIPFAFIAKIWGEPAVQVNGGFDGVSPLGSVFAVIKKRDKRRETYRGQGVRMGVPNVQRRDLLDFAYDVIVRASKAYDNV
jgi:hypothetical protein